MTPNEPAARPTAIVAARLREIRDRHRVSAAKLAECCADLGMPELNRYIITNIETGRRESISVDELYVLARALDVSPIHLLLPTEDQPVAVTPTEQAASGQVRDWITGDDPMGQTLVAWPESPARQRQRRQMEKAIWLTVHDARKADGTVDADELERQLLSALEDI
jgi:transcriptional regulator with XRE-family HTH domain